MYAFFEFKIKVRLRQSAWHGYQWCVRNCYGKVLCFFFVILLHKNPREIFPYGAPLLPTGILGKLTPPPSPLENLIPSVGVVWIFSGTKQ